MDEVSRQSSDILRWGVPITGLSIMILAWWRFRTVGVRLAVAGFGVMLVSPLVRQTLRTLMDRSQGFTAQDIGLIAAGAAVIGSFGLILVVVAMRRMIAKAEAAGSIQQIPGAGD